MRPHRQEGNAVFGAVGKTKGRATGGKSGAVCGTAELGGSRFCRPV